MKTITEKELEQREDILYEEELEQREETLPRVEEKAREYFAIAPETICRQIIIILTFSVIIALFKVVTRTPGLQLPGHDGIWVLPMFIVPRVMSDRRLFGGYGSTSAIGFISGYIMGSMGAAGGVGMAVIHYTLIGFLVDTLPVSTLRGGGGVLVGGLWAGLANMSHFFGGSLYKILTGYTPNFLQLEGVLVIFLMFSFGVIGGVIGTFIASPFLKTEKKKRESAS
nr:hypothetical protein [Candidatus Freyarchaeota archaeon]